MMAMSRRRVMRGWLAAGMVAGAAVAVIAAAGHTYSAPWGGGARYSTWHQTPPVWTVPQENNTSTDTNNVSINQSANASNNGAGTDAYWACRCGGNTVDSDAGDGTNVVQTATVTIDNQTVSR